MNKITGLRTILVLGIDMQNELINTLFDFGFIPIIREEMIQAFRALRHDSYLAVFIDNQNISDDILEFVLNIRDIDENIPVCVVNGVGGREKKILMKLDNVALIDNNREQIKEQLQSMVHNQ